MHEEENKYIKDKSKLKFKDFYEDLSISVGRVVQANEMTPFAMALVYQGGSKVVAGGKKRKVAAVWWPEAPNLLPHPSSPLSPPTYKWGLPSGHFHSAANILARREG